MDEDFTTIEHDFLHMKDYFNNYKFTYKERKSKLDFFQNITMAVVQELGDVIASTKQQLVEAKNIYKQLDVEIRELSQEVYEEEIKNKRKEEQTKELEIKEKELNEELKRLEEIDVQVREKEGMNEELDRIEEQIKGMYVQIGEEREANSQLVLESKLKEEERLKKEKIELAEKQKRLTIVNIEAYIEELYNWNEQMNKILSLVFGKIEINEEERGIVMRITADGAQLAVTLKGKQIIGAVFKNGKENGEERLNNVLEYACAQNDLRLLVCSVLYLN